MFSLEPSLLLAFSLCLRVLYLIEGCEVYYYCNTWMNKTYALLTPKTIKENVNISSPLMDELPLNDFQSGSVDGSTLFPLWFHL